MIRRREFLIASTGTLATAAGSWLGADRPHFDSWTGGIPAYSVTPVVGDGKWIWTKPPKDATGLLEARPYDVEIGIELEGVGDGSRYMSTTPALSEHPEQKIEDVQVEASGCEATIRQLTSGAAQLFVRGGLRKGQRARAVARYQVTLYKQFHNYDKDQFPAAQDPPKEIRGGFLQDSPGIQTRIPPVRKLAAELSGKLAHPWDKAKAFAQWVPRNIKPQLGTYTSVAKALADKRGDCEEMAAVFVALCRVVGIPARLVWVPNHNWAEFYLHDSDGKGHWIPAHTASYFWFGWTGAHELVLQKGDRVELPERRGKERLLRDWMRYTGRAPKTRYVGRLKPKPAEGQSDAGPGARNKDERGEWKVVGTHQLDRYLRQ